MRTYQGRLIYLFCVLAILLLSSSAFGELLPDGLVMEETYRPGLGSPIGRVLLVQGKVVIMHGDTLRGYHARKDIPLFKNDIIVTLEGGRIRFELVDESVMTMASKTRMVLHESVFHEKQKSRFSFLKMTLGKARFFVRKLADFKRSEFKVMTVTAIVGVRGSDFIIRIGSTEIIALEDTKLEVVSLAAPEVPPTVLEAFERAFVKKGELPTKEAVSMEEVEEMKKDFVIRPEEAGPEAKVEVKEKKAEEKEVLVSEQELVKPEEITAPEEIEEMVKPEIVKEIERAGDADDLLDHVVEIYKEQHETVVKKEISELPQFPGTPE